MDEIRPAVMPGRPGPQAGVMARVLIVDDHPATREGLAARIDRQPDLRVCGEAATVAEALTQIETSDPDVAIIDIALGDSDGLDLVRRVRARAARARMLVWSMYPDALFAERALRAGAMGYINKQEPTARIIEAIRCVLDGRLFVSGPISDRLLRDALARGPTEARSPIDRLSDRELQVFRLIGEGLTTAAIAEDMYLSVHTIETYRQRIKAKLDIATSAELARAAAHWVLENG